MKSLKCNTPVSAANLNPFFQELDDGRSTVLVPFAPTPMAGHVRVVTSDRLTLLDASLGQVFDLLSQWGMGSSKLLGSTSGK